MVIFLENLIESYLMYYLRHVFIVLLRKLKFNNDHSYVDNINPLKIITRYKVYCILTITSQKKLYTVFIKRHYKAWSYVRLAIEHGNDVDDILSDKDLATPCYYLPY